MNRRSLGFYCTRMTLNHFFCLSRRGKWRMTWKDSFTASFERPKNWLIWWSYQQISTNGSMEVGTHASNSTFIDLAFNPASLGDRQHGRWLLSTWALLVPSKCDWYMVAEYQGTSYLISVLFIALSSCKFRYNILFYKLYTSKTSVLDSKSSSPVADSHSWCHSGVGRTSFLRLSEESTAECTSEAKGQCNQRFCFCGQCWLIIISSSSWKTSVGSEEFWR